MARCTPPPARGRRGDEVLPFRSLENFRVEDVAVGQAPVEMVEHVLCDGHGHAHHGFGCGRRRVGSEDQPVAFEQRIVGFRRLVDLDVETRPHDAAAVERLEQRSLVDDAAACTVDDVGGGFHQGQLARADQVARILLQRHVHRDEVRVRQGRAKVGDGLAAHGPDLAGAVGGVDAETPDAERVQCLRQAAADAAEADDEHGAAGHVLGFELHLARIVTGAHCLVELRQPFGERVHERNGVLHH